MINLQTHQIIKIEDIDFDTFEKEVELLRNGNVLVLKILYNDDSSLYALTMRKVEGKIKLFYLIRNSIEIPVRFVKSDYRYSNMIIILPLYKIIEDSDQFDLSFSLNEIYQLMKNGLLYKSFYYKYYYESENNINISKKDTTAIAGKGSINDFKVVLLTSILKYNHNHMQLLTNENENTFKWEFSYIGEHSPQYSNTEINHFSCIKEPMHFVILIYKNKVNKRFSSDLERLPDREDYEKYINYFLGEAPIGNLVDSISIDDISSKN